MPEVDPETEFDICLARAGITLPPERRAAMFEAFLAWRSLRAPLSEPLPHATEPAFGVRQKDAAR